MENSDIKLELEELAGKLARHCFPFFEESIDKIEVDYEPNALSVTFIINSNQEKRVLSASTWLSTLLSSKRIPFNQESVTRFCIIGIPMLLDAFKPHQDPAPQISITDTTEPQ